MEKKNYLHQLDSLRGIAAIFVVVLHFQAYLTPGIGKIISEFTQSIHRSYILVDMFFILSGFVMALTYTKSFEKEIKLKNYFSFMKKRFIKLYPLHIITFLILVVLHRVILPQLDIIEDSFVLNRNNFHMMTNLFLLQSSGLGWGDCINCSSWNYPSWSISVEWLCYFSIPMLILFVKRFNNLSFLFIGFSYILFYFLIERVVGNTDVLTIPGIIRCLIGMFFGLSIYHHLYLKFSTPKWFFYITFCLAFFGLHFIPIDTVVILLMGLMIIASANLRIKTFLNSSPLLWLGKRSFSIYMTHVIVQDIVSSIYRYVYKQSIWDISLSSQLAVFIVSVVLVLIISELSYRFIEVKLHRFLRTKLVG